MGFLAGEATQGELQGELNVTSSGNNFNYFPVKQITKFRAV